MGPFGNVAFIVWRESIEALRPHAAKVVEREGDVLFILDDEDAVREIMRRVVAENAHLLSLTPRRDTLEEYFIREVSRGDQAGQPAPAEAQR